MTLRLRLLVAYGYLVGLILVAAGSAMLGFLHLSAGIDVVLEENYRSIQAAMVMVDSLERQNAVALKLVLEPGAAPAAREELARLEGAFRRAVDRAEANVTEPEELPVLAAIRTRFEAYRRRRDALVEERPARPLTAYEERVAGEFAAVKASVLDLLEINQRAMIRADRDAREDALRNGAWLGLLVTVALVSLVFLSRGLQRHVLARLARLRRGMAEVAEGAFGRRLPEEGDDELTMIARQVNSLLDRHQQLAARMRGRVAQELQLALGLVRMLGPGAAVYGLDGELLAGGLEADGATREAVVAWVRGPGREQLDAAEAPTELADEVHRLDGRPVELRLLATPDGRPVGWLARSAAAEG